MAAPDESRRYRPIAMHKEAQYRSEIHFVVREQQKPPAVAARCAELADRLSTAYDAKTLATHAWLGYFYLMNPIERGAELQREVETEKSLANFVNLVRNGKADVITLHQDAFAADYQTREYILLGMAIKYAGIFGRTIQISGRNRETLAAAGSE